MSRFSGLALAVESPRRLILRHPVSGRPLIAADGSRSYIDVFSADSDRARAHQNAVSRRRLDQRGPARMTPEELEADAIDLLVALTAGWSLVDLSGASLDVPFSAEAARELYASPGLAWLREQVDAFASDRANFGCASSSS